jgi:endonuclease YncB( thermonuclease family)
MPQSSHWLATMRGRGGIMAVGAAGIALACGGSSAGAQDSARANSGCSGEIVGQGTLARSVDGRTFVLSDGREIRLAAIETPPLSGPPDKDPLPSADAAKGALTGLLAGAQTITLKQAEPQPTDRYGRLVAYVYARRDGIDQLVQAELVGAGYAQVAAHVGNRGCAVELLGRETLARKAKLGLWAGSYYGLLNADSPTDVLAERGRFALVEGKVLSVRESGATIYVNFGRRWTEDFTVTILKRNERNFTAVGLDPKTLAGRRIRVRGWVEERGGPWIDATRPEQIEFADRE